MFSPLEQHPLQPRREQPQQQQQHMQQQHQRYQQYQQHHQHQQQQQHQQQYDSRQQYGSHQHRQQQQQQQQQFYPSPHHFRPGATATTGPTPAAATTGATGATAQTTAHGGDPGLATSATATSVRGPSSTHTLKLERSLKYRDFGLSAAASKASLSQPSTPVSLSHNFAQPSPTFTPTDSPARRRRPRSPLLIGTDRDHSVADDEHYHQPHHHYYQEPPQHHPHSYNNSIHNPHHYRDDGVKRGYPSPGLAAPFSGSRAGPRGVSPSPSPSPSPTPQYLDYADLEPPQLQQQPSTPVSPRWDSFAHSHPHALYDSPHIYPRTKTSVLTFPPPGSALSSPGPVTPNLSYEHDTLAALETRDEFPPPSPGQMARMSPMESRHAYGDAIPIENFSRPRRPSVKQPYPDGLRSRLGGGTMSSQASQTSQTDPTPAADVPVQTQQSVWPRERGLSISSNKSTSTFNSVPVRSTHDTHTRSDSIRGRPRNANGGLARPPVSYNRGESSGPTYSRDSVLPRMSSMPSGELRSSYRSHVSNSTAQGTMQTERSSIMTKNSSIMSMHGPIDDDFSLDDIMGMYEKGFRDDSPASRGMALRNEDHDGHPDHLDDDESRPPTARSELSRRKTLMLEAMSDSLPMRYSQYMPLEPTRDDDGLPGVQEEDAPEGAALSVPTAPGDPFVRDSAAIIRNSQSIYPSEKAEEAQILEHDIKHDSGKLVDMDEEDEEDDDDDEDDFPTRGGVPPALAATEEEEDDDSRDRYGFRKANQYITEEQYNAWNGGYTEYIDRRRKKWHSFLKESGLMTENPNRFPQRSTKTKRFVRKGIPPEWRGAAWFYYAGGPAIVAKHAGVYDDLLAREAKRVDVEAIERDLHRTFPDNIKFRSNKAPNTENLEKRRSQMNPTETDGNGNATRKDETAMISALRRVLHAFSIYNPRIGYCQSLNFLAGLLLLFVETEEYAFWLLNIITRVYLPGTHELSLEGANVDLAVLMSALRDSMPHVWAKIGGELDGTDVAIKPKLSRRNRKVAESSRLPPITLCMTAWFMSCFIGTLPIETTLRVWDVFFYEGSKTLFRIALTIFKIGESEIRNVSDPMEIFQVVQTIPRRLIDANAMMESCFKRRNGFGHLSQETIEVKRQERRDNNKVEKERVAAGLGPNDGTQRKGTGFSKRR